MPCIVFAGAADGDQPLTQVPAIHNAPSKTPHARRIAVRPQTCHDAWLPWPTTGRLDAL